MQYENLVYAVNGLQLSNNEQENIIILIYASNAEIAKNYITVYQQQNQLRLQYTFLPLPLSMYFQRHADETLIDQLKIVAQDLSEQHPILIFNPNQYLENEKSKTACLTKNEFPLRQEDEYSPFLFQSIPDSIKPYLWPEDSNSQCYAIINAEVSVWFPQRFELDDIQSACLFKGEEGERRKKTAPYLLHLPENHPFVEELCSESPKGKESEDGLQQWNKSFGFFFRSTATFDELLNHFRKFIYMPTYDGRLLYFRFYDPTVLEDYFNRLMYYPKKLATFWGGGLINAFIMPKGKNVICYTSNIDFSQIESSKKQFDQFEMREMIAQKDQKLLSQLTDEILETTPIISDYYSRDIIHKAVSRCYEICKQNNIIETRSIGILTIYSLACGKMIDILDPERKIPSILESEMTEMEKLYYIQERVNLLEQQGVIQNKFEEPHND
ncbi:DUF4123 domain-containing protein [uncultured Haemophilus sp.]|uniref:DUF4123 domain-containing protein n=1 Tax=uncultured Haemophilus sp. TaxID=237779 RepID=UPI0027DC75D1|nr:DUF4123 domain-containing protein [uncultured Haemophilus sp.]